MATAPIQSLQIMTWNVDGVKKKKDKIKTCLKELDKDIYFIQETHLSEEEARNLLEVENYQTHHAHYTTCSSKRGVAILIKNKIPFTFISGNRDSEGRYLIVKGQYGGRTLTLVNIYAPASGDDTESKEFFPKLFGKLEVSTNIIMGGDFNLRMEPEKDSDNSNIQRKQKSYEEVQKYMGTYDLCDIWRERNPERREYTFTVRSRIDYFLVSNSLREIITDNKILEKSISNHSPVLLKLCGSDVSIPDQREGETTFPVNDPELSMEKLEGGGASISAFVNLITGHKLTLEDIRKGLKGHFSREEIEKLEEELGTKGKPKDTPFYSYLEDLWDIFRKKYPTRITQVKWRKGESGEDYLQRVRTLWSQQSGTELKGQRMEQRYRRAVEAGCPESVKNKLRETGGLSSMPLEEWRAHVCDLINAHNG